MDYSKLSAKGKLYVGLDANLYEGMIIGELKSGKEDLDTCITKSADGYAKAGSCPDPDKMSLESCLSYIDSDECLEVTPTRIAMRKVILCQKQRKLLARKARKEM